VNIRVNGEIQPRNPVSGERGKRKEERGKRKDGKEDSKGQNSLYSLSSILSPLFSLLYSLSSILSPIEGFD
jgi:hypothetical protein